METRGGKIPWTAGKKFDNNVCKNKGSVGLLEGNLEEKGEMKMEVEGDEGISASDVYALRRKEVRTQLFNSLSGCTIH